LKAASSSRVVSSSARGMANAVYVDDVSVTELNIDPAVGAAPQYVAAASDSAAPSN
jgi:hypothetical protein